MLKGALVGLGVVLVLAGVGTVTVYLELQGTGYEPYSLEKAHGHLVTLRRVGRSSVSPSVMNNSFSGQTSDFDADGNHPRGVTLSYRGCPVTSKGAVRLTVYWSHTPKGAAIQYSKTLVDWKLSDRAEYEFPGLANTYFVYQVDVLSPHGCGAWTAGGETN